MSYKPENVYNQQQLETFIRAWQSSTSASQCAERLVQSPDFPDTYYSSWHNETRNLTPRFCQARASSLRRHGVSLRRLGDEAPHLDPINFDKLRCLAASVSRRDRSDYT